VCLPKEQSLNFALLPNKVLEATSFFFFFLNNDVLFLPRHETVALVLDSVGLSSN
jgi:hypothetical protein